MVGTHMPRVPSVDRGRRVDGCTWPGSEAGCVPTFSAPDGSPKPSPEWNPDAEVGGDYRIIRRRCVSGKAAIPGRDHRFGNTSAAAGSVKGLTRKWQCDVKRHIVTRKGELASRSEGGGFSEVSFKAAENQRRRLFDAGRRTRAYSIPNFFNL